VTPSDPRAALDARIVLVAVVVGASTTALCTWLFARIFERRGWVDDGADAPERKLQARAVAPVGGAAILCGCTLTELVLSRLGGVEPLSWVRFTADSADVAHTPMQRVLIVAALCAAFVAGLCDDLSARGLSALRKLGLQTIAAVPFAAAVGESSGDSRWAWSAGALACALVAQNAMNTFDNADGAATAVAGLGLAAAGTALAGALLGFVPFNLWIRRGESRARAASTPRAYLGDSGSHLLGLLLLLHPLARLALFLPLVDLVRVSLVRMRRGTAPWIGDRRHLAHRMLDRGASPTRTVVVLCAIAAPILAAGIAAGVATRVTTGIATDVPARASGSGSALVGVGASISLALFLVALRLYPARD
jgi:UDP-GlcNAc:undecaprenyl-phosphate GlcNAc-1-phosphate transferase